MPMPVPIGGKIKSANHHWWPQSLSKHWEAKDGCVTQLSWDSSEVRSPPRNFGAIRNAHHIKRGDDSPWNTTFEPDFDKADSQFPEISVWLSSLESKPVQAQAPLQRRFMAQPLLRNRRTQLAEALSSLIVRSPVSRNRIRITIEDCYGESAARKYPVDKTLIARNMQTQHEFFTRVINGGGKFLVLISDGPEFICGDGFLHNFPITTMHPLAARCIAPILPLVCVLFTLPQQYMTKPELSTMRVSADEVTFFNDVVQIYSRERVFYRNDKPRLTDAFAKHEHLEFPYHQHPWLDSLLGGVATFSPN